MPAIATLRARSRPAPRRDPSSPTRRASRPSPSLVAAVVVLATGLVPHAPVRQLTGAPIGARLQLPAPYVVISPVSRLLDALTLLSTAQHVAVLLTVLTLAGASSVVSARGTLRPRWSALRFGATRVALSSLALFGLYVAAALVARPAASLVVNDPDLVRVDFHSHTSASHDVPRWFDAGRRRAWAEATGFDVEFISDHRSFAGAVDAMRENPRVTGDGLVIAPALEGWFERVHVVLLGVTPTDTALLASTHLDSLLTRVAAHESPIAIATLPDRVLSFLRPAIRDGAPFVRAMEASDAAPRALRQRDREGDAIAARRDALGLVPIASSNHHGWGHAALAWTLVRVPGWRAMTPDTLTARIVDVLRRGDRGAVRIVERERPAAAGSGAPRLARLAITVPTLAWQALASLAPIERLVWLAWLGALVLVRQRVARWRARRASARVHDVAVVVDADLLVGAAHAAHEARAPRHVQLGTH